MSDTAISANLVTRALIPLTIVRDTALEKRSLYNRKFQHSELSKLVLAQDPYHAALYSSIHPFAPIQPINLV